MGGQCEFIIIQKNVSIWSNIGRYFAKIKIVEMERIPPPHTKCLAHRGSSVNGSIWKVIL